MNALRIRPILTLLLMVKRIGFTFWNWSHGQILVPLFSILFPSDCPVCLRPLGRFHLEGICFDCWASLKLIRTPFCAKCGIPFGSKSSKTGFSVTNAYDEMTCPSCEKSRLSFSRARSLAEYTGSMRKIIHCYKFHNKPFLAEPLADLMLKILDIGKIFGNIDAIIAVPLHRKKRKERGFNQASLIAKRLGKKLRIRVEKSILIRIKRSQPQMNLPADQREKNVRGIFEVRKAKRISGKRILLIDDVMTTGATVNECARVLKRAGCKDVCVLVLAHTPHLPSGQSFV